MQWILFAFGLLGGFIWICILALPWRPWGTKENLDSAKDSESEDLSNVTVMIPARNEAEAIGATMEGLNHQGRDLKIILIDDQSSDGTAEIARSVSKQKLEVIAGTDLPQGWAGKLWALEQGRQHLKTPYVILHDADIEVEPGLIATLRAKLELENLDFVSLMAELRMKTFWEKLLVPAYVYFFKLLYPFALGNSPKSKIAVAAGGCILTRKKVLDEIGGFGVLKNALIDDCSLSRAIKSRGGKTWMGLTHSVKSHRSYAELSTVWNLVARSAFTQLRYSNALLIGCTLIMLTMFWMPIVGLIAFHSGASALLLSLGLLAMLITYTPTLIYYDLSIVWSLLLPIIGTLYLAMTWTSAFRYWFGSGAQWKGRFYSTDVNSKAA